MNKTIEDDQQCTKGKGSMRVEQLFSENELGKHIHMFAKITMDVNSSFGYSIHREDGTAYYILKGTGWYNENGKTRLVQAGDRLFTPPGNSHSMENIGTDPLVFIAIVIRAIHVLQP